LALVDHFQAQIWGDSTQVGYARAALEEFEKSIQKEHNEKRKDLGKWERINALDGRKEHREERKAKVDQIVAQHVQLESSAEYNFEVGFVAVRLQNLKTNKNEVLAVVALASPRI
jgi:hypothetical protein